MKRLVALLLCLLLLPFTGAYGLAEDVPPPAADAISPAVDALSPAETAAPQEEPLPHLYTGRMRLSARVYESWEIIDGVNHFATLPEGVWVKIHAVYPTYVLVTYESGGVTGYVNRICIENPRIIDNQHTPPYGVDFNHFIAAIGADSAPITTIPGGGDTLITLYKGAKISFIGFENGYAKIIYHRQYGYIDSNLLTDLQPVYYGAEDAGTDHPIASYTSFYKITTDKSNLNRIHNLKVACEKMCRITLNTGDELNFNRDIGPYRTSEGYLPAGTITEEGLKDGVGGGTCQVSSTLYNVVLQLPGLYVIYRRAHGNNGASYLPIWVDAAVGNSTQNFRFRNLYPFPIRFDTWVQDGAITIMMYRAE
ncbi:MAG: VanW family protein [Clostridia bacterium]|nr:VanW family protein [Clostridia bacterium]